MDLFPFYGKIEPGLIVVIMSNMMDSVYLITVFI